MLRLGRQETVTKGTRPQGSKLRRQGKEGCRRCRVTNPVWLEFVQPERATRFPAHSGVKGGLEVTMRHDKAGQVWGVSRAEAG